MPHNRIFGSLLPLLVAIGCARAAVQPAHATPLPLPLQHATPLPITLAVETLLGEGNYPCEQLASPVIARLREQQLFSDISEAWTGRSGDLTLRLTFHCRLDEHPTRTLYNHMAIGATFFAASVLPLFDVDFTATATADLVQGDRVLRRYQAATQVDGDANYWAYYRTDWLGAVVRQGEADLVAQLVTGLVDDMRAGRVVP